MVSWWSAEGNALDIWDGNDGAALNGAGYAAGMVGQAFSLDGIDDHVAVPDHPSLDITGDLTVDAWVYPTALGEQRVIVSKRSFDNNDANIIFFMQPDGRLSFSSRVGGGGFPTVTSLNAIPLNQWTHVAVTIKGTTLTFYINGAVDSSPFYGDVRPANDGVLAIGIVTINPVLIPPNGLAAGWSGLLDEIEIFNLSLGGGQVAGIYAAGSAGKCLPATDSRTSTWGRLKGLYR
jgi:hypothetical protein